MRLRASLAVVLLVPLTTGCTTTYTIPKSELVRLDGWRDDGSALRADVSDAVLGSPRNVRWVRDEDGAQQPFGADTPLVLVRQDGAALDWKYVQVRVDALRFEGVPLHQQEPVVVPLEEVRSASVRRFSLPKTLLLLGAVGVGALGSVVLVGKLIWPASTGTNTGSDTGTGNTPCGKDGCKR
jgi:hypothetical protein